MRRFPVMVFSSLAKHYRYSACVACAAARTAPMLVEPSFLLATLRALLPDDDDGDGDDDASDDPLRFEASDAAKIDAGCIVWDLSANAETASFMREHGLLSLLLHPLGRAHAHSSRLLEICAGTCANLVAVDEPSCAALLTNEGAPATCSTLLLCTSDAPTLLELLRLLTALLAAAAAAVAADDSGAARHTLERWMRPLLEHPSLAALAFILCNTLRTELMARAATLLSTVLYCHTLLPQPDAPAGPLALLDPQLFLQQFQVQGAE